MKLQIVFNGIKIIVLLAVLVSLGLFLWRGSISLTKGEAGESLKQLETSIRKATMLCYAAEGVYPPDLQYLKDHYGIQIDEDLSLIHISEPTRAHESRMPSSA